VVINLMRLVRPAATPRAIKPSTQGTENRRWSLAQIVVKPRPSAASA
jgi:hypothetical protein